MSGKNVSGMRMICRWRDRASSDPMRANRISSEDSARQ